MTSSVPSGQSPDALAIRQHFSDVLGDIADSFINDPGQRKALIDEVMHAYDFHPGPALAARTPQPPAPAVANCPSCGTTADVCAGVSGCCEACTEIGRVTMHAAPQTGEPR